MKITQKRIKKRGNCVCFDPKYKYACLNGGKLF